MRRLSFLGCAVRAASAGILLSSLVIASAAADEEMPDHRTECPVELSEVFHSENIIIKDNTPEPKIDFPRVQGLGLLFVPGNPIPFLVKMPVCNFFAARHDDVVVQETGVQEMQFIRFGFKKIAGRLDFCDYCGRCPVVDEVVVDGKGLIGGGHQRYRLSLAGGFARVARDLFSGR